jgi:hypothetical protein
MFHSTCCILKIVPDMCYGSVKWFNESDICSTMCFHYVAYYKYIKIITILCSK